MDKESIRLAAEKSHQLQEGEAFTLEICEEIMGVSYYLLESARGAGTLRDILHGRVTHVEENSSCPLLLAVIFAELYVLTNHS